MRSVSAVVVVALFAFTAAMDRPERVPFAPYKYSWKEANGALPDPSADRTTNGKTPEEVKEDLRIRSLPGLSDEAVENHAMWSGYVNHTPERLDEPIHTFFWLYEAKNGRDSNTPTLLWLNGGPGCSSLLGALSELGPYYVKEDLSLGERANHWNAKYNLLVIDQPVDTGFSYVSSKSSGALVGNMEQMGDDLYWAVAEIMRAFPEFATELYLTGESYAGKYLPALAHRCFIAEDQELVPLRGVAIGDGLTEPIHLMRSYATWAYDNSLIGQFDQFDEIVSIQEAGVKAIEGEDWHRASELLWYTAEITNYHAGDENWSTAGGYLGRAAGTISSYAGGINVYDIRNDDDPIHGYDFPYLNSAEVKAALGVPAEVDWEECRGSVYGPLSDDIAKSIGWTFPDLLSKYRVLIYNGDRDLLVNNESNDAFTRSIEWPHKEEFANADRVIWRARENNDIGGWVRCADNLCFATVRESGHMAPADQPINCQDMIERFVDNAGWN